MILLIGSEGSMGKRYQAILNSLKVPFSRSDIGYPIELLRDIKEKYKGIIIATPTDIHFRYIALLFSLGIPILCEKPLSKSKNDFKMFQKYISEGLSLTMMLQYKFLTDKDDMGPSSYDYFRTGNDGLLWDCLQIIGLAKGSVEIKNESPVWQCTLNGRKLSLADMDQAYVDAVKSWLNGEKQDFKEIKNMHEKVMNLGVQ